MTKQDILDRLDALRVQGYSIDNTKNELEDALADAEAPRKAPPGGGYS